jgi:hypothetical protein
MNHVKPTKEELKAGAEAALKELEAIDQAPSEPPIEEPAPTVEETTPAEPPQEDTSELKKKLSNSAREAQVLQSRTKKYDEAVEQAEGINPPSDEDMQVEYGTDDWDGMSNAERKLAKDAWLNKRRFEVLSQVAKEGKNIEKWNTSVDSFVDDPKNLIKYPELEGKVEDFKVFATKPTRRGLDMEDLILAFNGDMARSTQPKKKGQMFETGTPGNSDKPQPQDDKISATQGRVLMKTDYNKWKAMLKAGKIKNE